MTIQVQCSSSVKYVNKTSRQLCYVTLHIYLFMLFTLYLLHDVTVVYIKNAHEHIKYMLFNARFMKMTRCLLIIII